MIRIVAIILTLVGLMIIIKHGCPDTLVATKTSSTQGQDTVSKFSSTDAYFVTISSSLEDEKRLSRHNDCADCGNPMHECHQCHFGYCGFIVNQTKFSRRLICSQNCHTVENLTLKSFIPSLFRPPIS